MTEWTKQRCICTSCFHIWTGVVAHDAGLECPRCERMDGVIANERNVWRLYIVCKISIGKVGELLGLDIYQTLARRKELGIIQEDIPNG